MTFPPILPNMDAFVDEKRSISFKCSVNLRRWMRSRIRPGKEDARAQRERPSTCDDRHRVP